MSEHPRIDDLPDILTAEEVRAVLRIGRNEAYRLLGSDDLATVRVGRSIRVTKHALMDFLSVGPVDGED